MDQPSAHELAQRVLVVVGWSELVGAVRRQRADDLDRLGAARLGRG
jgi:hypothetical protein